jgi:hypothetical protein
MHIIIGLFFIAHGIVHLVGFLSYWQITTIETMPYKTTQLAGRFDAGDTGIRVIGILWLIATLAFIAAGFGLIFLQPWWQTLTLYTTIYSLVLSILGWPDSRFGLVINVLILAYLFVGGTLGWLPEIGD